MKKFKTGELIGKTSRLISNKLANELHNTHIGITSEQWIILQILSGSAKTQKELSEITIKNKATINSLVSYLLKSKLILKETSSSDKRIKQISISDEGIKRMKLSDSPALKVIEQATKGFSEKEIDELNNYLNRITNNLLK